MNTPTPDASEQEQQYEYLRQALDEHEEQSVEWYKECEADIKESGYALSDGKELRRARKWVENCVKAIAEAYAAQTLRQVQEQALIFHGYEALDGGGLKDTDVKAVPLAVIDNVIRKLEGKNDQETYK